MTYSLEFLPEAKLEMKETFQWYEGRQEGLGDDFTAEVENALDRLLLSPTSYGIVVIVHGVRERSGVIRGFLRSVCDVVDRHGRNDCETNAGSTGDHSVVAG